LVSIALPTRDAVAAWVRLVSTQRCSLMIAARFD
jgi:hypothetical protein